MRVHRGLIPHRSKYKWGTAFSVNTKEKVWERDEGACVYCGAPGAEIDHVVPRRQGGPSIRQNAVVACKSCNMKKGGELKEAMLARAFYHLLRKGESLYWLDDE